MLYTRTESVDRQGRHDGHGRHYQLIVGGLAEPEPGLGPRLSVALCREASLSLVTRQAGCAKPKLDPRPITMEVFGTKDTHTPMAWLETATDNRRGNSPRLFLRCHIMMPQSPCANKEAAIEEETATPLTNGTGLFSG